VVASCFKLKEPSARCRLISLEPGTPQYEIAVAEFQTLPENCDLKGGLSLKARKRIIARFTDGRLTHEALLKLFGALRAAGGCGTTVLPFEKKSMRLTEGTEQYALTEAVFKALPTGFDLRGEESCKARAKLCAETFKGSVKQEQVFRLFKSLREEELRANAAVKDGDGEDDGSLLVLMDDAVASFSGRKSNQNILPIKSGTPQVRAFSFC